MNDSIYFNKKYGTVLLVVGSIMSYGNKSICDSKNFDITMHNPQFFYLDYVYKGIHETEVKQE